jgi:hypothetical protein
VKFLQAVFRLLLVLWAGSLGSLLWVAATLFQLQSDRHTAGLIAGRLFSIETYLGLGVAAIAALLPSRARFRLGFAAAGVLCANEWLLKRAMSAAQTQGSALALSFGAWHGLSATLYLVACICVAVMIYKDEVLHA